MRKGINIEKVLKQGDKGNDMLQIDEKNPQTVRMMPPEDEGEYAGNPFEILHFHYSIGDVGTILCPKKNFQEPCAICDLAMEFYEKSKAASSKEEKKMWLTEAKKYFSKERYFTNVVVRGSESDGPKLYSFPYTIYNEFLAKLQDKEYGDISDLETGTDFTFAGEQKKLNDKPIVVYKLEFKRHTSKLCQDEEECEKLLSKPLKRAIDKYTRYTSSEVSDVLENAMKKLEDNTHQDQEITKSADNSVTEQEVKNKVSEAIGDEFPF